MSHRIVVRVTFHPSQTRWCQSSSHFQELLDPGCFRESTKPCKIRSHLSTHTNVGSGHKITLSRLSWVLSSSLFKWVLLCQGQFWSENQLYSVTVGNDNPIWWFNSPCAVSSWGSFQVKVYCCFTPVCSSINILFFQNICSCINVCSGKVVLFHKYLALDKFLLRLIKISSPVAATCIVIQPQSSTFSKLSTNTNTNIKIQNTK